MKVLLIDDDRNSVEPLCDELKTNGYEICYYDFPTDIVELVERLLPDAIVLDLKAGKDAGGENLDNSTGIGMKEQIWEKRFIPLLVYSAFADNCNDAGHPFVGYIKKGMNSEQNATLWLNERKVAIQELSNLKVEISFIMNQVMKLVVEYFGSFSVDDSNIAMMKFLSMRRVAAFIDQYKTEPAMPAVSIYITPPICDHPRLADIIKNRETESIHLVLTPSCDLGSSGQSPKVDKVIVADCEEIDREVFERLSLSTKPEKLRKRLNDWSIDEYVALPSLGTKFKCLAANLKKVSQINIIEVCPGEQRKYDIIASIDSPYREKIAWSFIQQVGRPGVPNIDFDKMIDEIISIGNDS